MSAFEVSNTHIDALVNAALRGDRHGPLSWYFGEIEWDGDIDHYNAALAKARREVTRENAETWGAVLLAENRASVNYRYTEDEIEAPYIFTEIPGHLGALDAVAILKAIRCYAYQACEHPEWKASEARAFCDALTVQMINMLPGYDAAKWEVDSFADVLAHRVAAA